MGNRRKSRELAVQALYRVEITGDESAEGLERLWQHFEGPIDARSFAVELVSGVRESRERIDALLRGAAENWSLERLSRVDLNVLRVAAYELLCSPDVPPRVAIDEAIEVARRFGGEESAHFVNGVLDAVARSVGRVGGASAKQQ